MCFFFFFFFFDLSYATEHFCICWHSGHQQQKKKKNKKKERKKRRAKKNIIKVTLNTPGRIRNRPRQHPAILRERKIGVIKLVNCV